MRNPCHRNTWPFPNRNRVIRQLLAEGPATSVEITASLGVARDYVWIGLNTLLAEGHIEPTGAKVSNGRHMVKIYRLTPRGAALARRDSTKGENVD